MHEIINKHNLFCDKERMVTLCEYKEALSIIKRLLELTASSVAVLVPPNTWSHEGVCYQIAKSIVEYLKMAYDNLLLGHVYASQMILRVVVENSVCLSVIQKYQEQELWKYYIVQPSYDALKAAKPNIKDFVQKSFDELCEELEISDEFFINSKKNESSKAYRYADRPYGWTYKVNKTFSFPGLCNLIDEREYTDFQMASMYSHGTSIYLKICDFTSEDNIMNILSLFYYYIDRLASTYCSNNVTDEFGFLMNKAAIMFKDYIVV